MFGVPDCVYKEKNLFDVLAPCSKKTALVGVRADSRVVRGNVSIDHSTCIEKYIDSEYSLVITEWTDIKLSGIDSRSDQIPKIISQWDERISQMVSKSPDTILFIILSGEGDTKLANQYFIFSYDSLRDKFFHNWTSSQEKMWTQLQIKLNMNFGIFFNCNSIPRPTPA
jgi:hypothetical protein